ncbi:L-histidine N(alpha)-methyltransferase [Caulobacter sp. S45]|uniref:L-histidine N(alpha)-methyltransferase n=1 Tax=Caulobacter sp. S45 TaxID=1641861 RepID=UPI00157675E9|nr:L-histidine N(alpha)-methyltransferase [Caulobacter sp. S45]
MNSLVDPLPGDSPRFSLHDFAPAQESFEDAVVEGLSGPRKSVPARFLYDEAGSRLFDCICELPEYYPTRTELKILTDKADEIGASIGPDIALLEFGAGSSQKARLLLDALERPAAYEPIDVSREHLIRLADEIADAYPGLAVRAICADYTQPLELPDSEPRRRRAGFFPGSTIGNLTSAEARAFLSGWAGQLGRDGLMVVGVALRAPSSIVLPAYDDAQGVTARFTANVLVRANRELGADFDVAAFRHTPTYDETTGRLTIHLTSLKAQTVHLAGRRFDFAEGEQLHVEESNKYAAEDFQALARSAGYVAETVWIDPGELFSVHVLRVA